MKAMFVAVLLVMGLQARAEVAISIRYFKAKGTSHYHLYLYREDGKMLRQLTAPEDAHDMNPVFSPDGSEIVFIRSIKAETRSMAIRPDGSELRALPQAPAWYFRSNPANREKGNEKGDDEPLWKARGTDSILAVPDGKSEIVLKREDNCKDEDSNYTDRFKALVIRDLPGGSETRVEVKGEEHEFYCTLEMCGDSPFLLRDGLRLLFYSQHLNSTDKDRLGVLDLIDKKAMFLSANPAVAIPHDTRRGFFCVCKELYQPLPGTRMTVNCTYLDWWNAELKRTRFARALSLFGGASVRVKGQAQMDIPLEDAGG